ncbi:MAG TPA: hypothetical protein VJV97_10555 [Gemmatimonadaceae bacterium]|nr:hypothetical protein [Gemmatimonadaceae bacterium]
MSSGRLAKYSVWQFRDFVLERGIGIVIIGFLWGYVMFEPLRRTMGAQWTGDQTSPVWGIALQVAAAVASLSVLIAMNGIVSTDRKNGYYRFLFSKPVNPVVYYAQLFVVYGIGLLTAMAVLSSLFHLIFPAFSIVNFLLYAAVIYVAMGGIGFFLSVATRYDWLSLAAIWLGSRILRGVYGPKHDWRSKAVELLPPVHRLDEVANSLIGRGTANNTDVVWLVGYGLFFFVLGLVIIRYGSLAD